MTLRNQIGANSQDFQLMFLHDVDAVQDIGDHDLLVFDEPSERFIPATRSGAQVAVAEFKAGDVAGGNYTHIQADGSVMLHGTACVFDDYQVNESRRAGSRDPIVSVWMTNGAGSRGTIIDGFDDQHDNEKELYYPRIQMPHRWREGSTIHPHIHWTPLTSGAGTVKWALEYEIVDIGEVAGNTTTIVSNTTIQAPASLVANTHYLTELPDIDMTGRKMSCMITARLYRNSSDLVNDTFTGVAGLLSFDFHIEIDSLGSHEEYGK